MDDDKTEREDLDSTETSDKTPPTVPLQAHDAPRRIGPYRLLEKLGEGGWARSGWRSRLDLQVVATQQVAVVRQRYARQSAGPGRPPSAAVLVSPR